MTTRRALAVDLGGTRLRAALIDEQGMIEHRVSMPTPASEGADAVVAAIAGACRQVMASGRARKDLVVGLCSPGPIDARRGIALATPTIRGFVDFPLAKAVEQALGLEVTVENDGPCAAIGEWIFGEGKGSRDFVYITISTGIGGGIIADGRILRGALGLAGHVGHMITRPGLSWEAQASGPALTARARALGCDTLPEAFERARSGDGPAITFAKAAAEDLASGLVGVIHLLNPERIVIGGGVANAFDILGPMIRKRVAEQLLPPFRPTPILHSTLGDDQGLLGASQLALHPRFRAAT